jgi:hypothetical protein
VLRAHLCLANLAFIHYTIDMILETTNIGFLVLYNTFKLPNIVRYHVLLQAGSGFQILHSTSEQVGFYPPRLRWDGIGVDGHLR